MTIGRVTQRMLVQDSLGSLQAGLGRLAKVQEQLSTGRILNRPSDSPTDTTAAMRIRSSIADQEQYARNAADGLGWLGQIDSTLATVTDQVRRARDLGIQGRDAALGPVARAGLATEVEQLREAVRSATNATYLDRPVFGGITTGSVAYDASGAFVGAVGDVNRRVADGVVVKVDLDGPAVFGPTGDSIFTELDELATALRTGSDAGLSASLDRLMTRLDTIVAARTDAGARFDRLEKAALSAEDAKIGLLNSLSTIENTDLPKATVDLQLQEVAYQASLAATSRVMQPSLLDFLR